MEGSFRFQQNWVRRKLSTVTGFPERVLPSVFRVCGRLEKGLLLARLNEEIPHRFEPAQSKAKLMQGVTAATAAAVGRHAWT